MKRLNFRFALITAAMLLAASCEKQEGAQNEYPILFEIDNSALSAQSKTVITTDNLEDMTVRAYATRSNTAINYLNGSAISKKSTGYWKPSYSVSWVDNYPYTFRVYAYSGNITVSQNNGSKFSVTQPTTYEVANMADYVISDLKSVSAAESYKHPIIDLTLKHVLPMVEVYVVKVPAMNAVTVKSLTIKGLYNAATLEYSTTDEVWLTDLSGDRSSAVYTLSGSFAVANTKADTEAKMSILTVPQPFTQESRLVVTYSVDETVIEEEPITHEYTQEFVLGEKKSSIDAGYRAVFYLSIDTGIHLQASIVPWNQVDFIEGTVLPTI